MIADQIKNYSFEYVGAMDDAMQSLPLGNGEMGANVWMPLDGEIHLVLSKTDSWSELYRLLKLAHVALSIKPCPFEGGAHFCLNIAEGVLEISKGGNLLRIYADASAPCVRLLLRTETPVRAELRILNYRSEAFDPGDDFSNYFSRGGDHGIMESADTVAVTAAGGMAQIHRNDQSCYEFSLKNQHMEAYIGKEKDPLLGLTFGIGAYSPHLVADGEALVGERLTQMQASIFSDTAFTEDSLELADRLDALHALHGDADDAGYALHAQSWRSYWEKAYILASGDEQAEQITKAFLYQRYLTHCSDRGNAPVKYNGLLFICDQMEGYPGNYDARRWGAGYWFQNTRIPYWYLLCMGDYEAMHPFFDMYLNVMPVAEARCKNYFGHRGMLIPETISHFGLYANSNYGFADENGIRRGEGGKGLRRGEPCNSYIRYHFNGMLEMSYMMLKYLELSGDTSRRERMLSFIEQTLLFFDNHFDRFGGKLVMTPVSALETWQLCVNDLPDVAGLRAVCDKLNAMQGLSPSLRSLLDDLMPAIPAIPTEQSEAGTVLAPCEIKIHPKEKNYENPELYAVFPYQLYGLEKADLDVARRTYEKRKYRLDGGWSQDPVDAALLGLMEETQAHLIRQSGMTDKRALFPGFWGPNFDETPDQDHGGITSLALIYSLLQTDGSAYKVFPVWPEKWNVQFRLPARHDLFICGAQVDGERTVREERS